MGSLFKTLLCLTPALLLSMPVQAQNEGGDENPALAQAEGPDPVDLLRQADGALTALKSMSYTARSEGFGATATHSPVVDGKAELRRDAGGDAHKWLFNIEGRITPAGATSPSDFHVAFDGTTGRSVDNAHKLYQEATGTGVGELLRPGPGRILNWTSMWAMVATAPLASESDSLSLSYEGVAVVGGVPCDVVRQDTSNFTDIDEYVLWWFLGQADHLPRRLDSFYLETDGGTNGLDVLTITNLRIGADVSDSALTIAPPDGYEVRKIEAAKEPSRSASSAREAPASLEGKPAPAWTLKDPSGVEHSLADYKGKVVLIDFWATWCGWCKLGMPAIQKLHEKYKGKDVEIIGITVWEAGDPVKFMKDSGFTYTLLLHGDDVAPDYGIQNIPRLVVIGKDGSVVHDTTGYDEKAEANLSAVIDKALEAK